MRKWKIQTNSQVKNVDEIIKTVLLNRGIKPADFARFKKPVEPDKIKLKDTGIDKKEIKKAVKRLKKAIKDKQPIFIYGDYDADGICASAIMWEAIYSLGGQVLPFMPKRDKHGYGLNQAGIDDLLDSEAVVDKKPLILTVDNGIVAHDGVKYAYKKGLEVVITDHHRAKKTLPEAGAVVHSTKIAGAGVAWFLARELLKNKKKSQALLDLAAVGTVADMMELTGVNRSMVKFGLPVLAEQNRPGWRKLFQTAGVKGDLKTYHINFMIAPRLNAAGRIGHALDSLRLICTRNPQRADNLAKKLNRANVQRQNLTEEILTHADPNPDPGQKLEQKILFSADQSYHAGVIGLVAGRLSSKYYRPAIVISMEEKFCRGSVRSIKGFNIIKALREFEDLFEDLGGHPMAAGFTISIDNLPELEKNLVELAEKSLKDEDLQPVLEIDCQIDLNQINQKLYRAVEKLAPFGIANPRPVFASAGLEAVNIRAVGADNKHLKLKLKQGEKVFDAIGFNLGWLAERIELGQKVNLAYNIDENTFNGRTSLQLKIKDIQPADLD